MALDHAYICGIGMMTPVGDCTAQTATSVQAGISRYQQSTVYNRRFNPMTMALLPEDALPELTAAVKESGGLTQRQERMVRLAHPAIIEALENLPVDNPPLPLMLAGPETLPGRPLAITDSFISVVAKQAEIAIDVINSRMFASGRAGGILALEAAFKMLEAGQVKHVLVGGVDTYLDLALLDILDLEQRVLAESVMDGFAPGEGAGFLLLGSKPPANAKTIVHKPGIGLEKGHRYSEETHTGSGLADAVRTSLENLQAGPVNSVLCSLNGESQQNKDWMVAYQRNSRALNPDFRIEHPAEYYGDVGAATAPVLIGLAATGMAQGWLEGPCLTWAASEMEQRGSACVALNT